MAELELPGGFKFKGGKIFAIITALATFVGALYGVFVAYKDYTDFKNFIQNEYVEPDLSGFDKRIDLVQQQVDMLQSEMTMILEEVNLVASTAKELKDDLKSDVRTLQQDSRHTESVVNSVKNNTRDELRLFEQSIKDLEGELELKINKALANPLAGVK
jgi:uncharacterized protein YoxC